MTDAEALKAALAGLEQETDNQLLVISKRARVMASEVSKANALLQAKDAEIMQLLARVKELEGAGDGVAADLQKE